MEIDDCNSPFSDTSEIRRNCSVFSEPCLGRLWTPKLSGITHGRNGLSGLQHSLSPASRDAGSRDVGTEIIRQYCSTDKLLFATNGSNNKYVNIHN